MNPIPPPAYEGTRAVTFADSQPQYQPLPARVDHDGKVYSAWELTEEERTNVMKGAPIILIVSTYKQPLQPVSIVVGDVPA